jgi:hypothetical protein
MMNLKAAVQLSLVVGLAYSFLGGTACGAENSGSLLAPAPAINATNPDLQAADQRVQAAESQLETARKQLSAAKSLLKAAEADLKAARADRQALSLRQEAEGLAEQAGMGSPPPRQLAASDQLSPARQANVPTAAANIPTTAPASAPPLAATQAAAPPDQNYNKTPDQTPEDQGPLIQLR